MSLYEWELREFASTTNVPDLARATTKLRVEFNHDYQDSFASCIEEELRDHMSFEQARVQLKDQLLRLFRRMTNIVAVEIYRIRRDRRNPMEVQVTNARRTFQLVLEAAQASNLPIQNVILRPYDWSD